MKKTILGILLLGLLGVFAVACETEDDNKLASAQQCMDKITDTSTTTDAQACINKVNGLSSPESYVIRCSALFFIGGITPSGLIDAFANNFADLPEQQQTANLMGALNMTSTTAADAAYSACEKSGVASLIYIAGLAKMGTYLVDGGGGDPATFASNCAMGGCDDATIGSVAVTVADEYCVGDAADSQICKDVESAIASNPGNYAAIAQALYGLIDY